MPSEKAMQVAQNIAEYVGTRKGVDHEGFECVHGSLPVDIAAKLIDEAIAEARNAAFEEATQHLENVRMGNEAYGHAKAAVALDVEAIRALRTSTKEGG